MKLTNSHFEFLRETPGSAGSKVVSLTTNEVFKFVSIMRPITECMNWKSKEDQKLIISVIFGDGTEIVRSIAREYLRKWPLLQQERFAKLLDEVRSENNDLGNTNTNTGFAPLTIWQMLDSTITFPDSTPTGVANLNALANDIILINDSDLKFHFVSLIAKVYELNEPDLQKLLVKFNLL